MPLFTRKKTTPNTPVEFQYKKKSKKECFESVYKKLKSIYSGISENELRNLANNLSDKKKLIESMQEQMEALEDYFTANQPSTTSMSNQKRSGPFASVESHASGSIPNVEDPRYHLVANRKDRKVKVKLVVGETARDPKTKICQLIMSPVFSHLNITSEFGLFHTALIVGPWYIDWNNSSICRPRMCQSRAAIIALDINNNITKINIDQSLDKLADVILEWNICKAYDQKKENCQHFVEDLLKSLGCNHAIQSLATSNYLKKLREKGKCSLRYKLSPEQQKLLGTTESKIRFESHEDLDQFVNKLKKVDQNFEVHPDFQFLKSFDRAFWLRHFVNQSDVSYRPCDCPFGDPRDNGSIIR
mmetsp:Transcript_2375/g.3452  ORF Transcript_2375/g.3452 Transcript_2375/m.3452 type:complete len:359 (+) Transcript_2375:57-1133(+)